MDTKTIEAFIRRLTDKQLNEVSLLVMSEKHIRRSKLLNKEIAALGQNPDYEEFSGTFGEFLQALMDRLDIRVSELDDCVSPYITDVSELDDCVSPYITDVDEVNDLHERFVEVTITNIYGQKVSWNGDGTFYGDEEDDGFATVWRIKKSSVIQRETLAKQRAALAELEKGTLLDPEKQK